MNKEKSDRIVRIIIKSAIMGLAMLSLTYGILFICYPFWIKDNPPGYTIMEFRGHFKWIKEVGTTEDGKQVLHTYASCYIHYNKYVSRREAWNNYYISCDNVDDWKEVK